MTFIPLLIREALCRDKATIISYHDIEPGLFRAHLKYLTKHYNVISLDRLVSAVRKEAEWKALPKKALVITMDDGFSGNYELMPVLDEFKIPITIFIRPGGVDIAGSALIGEKRYLDKEEIIELLKHGVSLGAHSITHPELKALTYEEVLREINGSKEYLEKEFQIQIKYFAYPYGDYGKKELEILKKGGVYSAARTTKPGWIQKGADPYQLRCMWVGDESLINKMVLEVTGIFPFLRLLRRRFFQIQFNEYKTPMTYITGILGLRGAIAQHTPRQAELIEKYAKGKKRLVEIGVSEGGSALIALKVMDPRGKMWLIDPYKSVFYPFYSMSLNIAKKTLSRFKDKDITIIRDSSQNVAKGWNARIDYLLMDGCNSEDAFIKDWGAWSGFVDEGGVVLIQSARSPSGLETGYTKAIRRLFCKNNSEWSIIDKADATVVVKRRRA